MALHVLSTMVAVVMAREAPNTDIMKNTKRGVMQDDAPWILKRLDADGDGVWSVAEADVWLFHLVNNQVSTDFPLEQDEELYAASLRALDADNDSTITQDELKAFLYVLDKNAMKPNRVPNEVRYRWMLNKMLEHTGWPALDVRGRVHEDAVAKKVDVSTKRQAQKDRRRQRVQAMAAMAGAAGRGVRKEEL